MPSSAPTLARLARIEPGEGARVLWSFGYFFCLLSSYYVLRPVRDEMGISGGVDQLQWLFTATFLVMLAAVPLFGWAGSRLPRRRLVPAVYLFFGLHILGFHLAFAGGADFTLTARAFFVWTSVFNLFVVSVFWSFMADIFSAAQARRLFGFVAAGGSLGAMAGPALAGLMVGSVGTINLLPVSAGLLGGALGCVWRLNRLTERDAAGTAAAVPLPPGIWHGVTLVLRSPFLLGVCLFMLLFTTLATFLYFEQAHIVADAFPDRDSRTALFAWIDLAVNALTILFQLLVTGRLMQRYGLATALAAIPVLLAFGFLVLGALPVVAVLVPLQVLRRAGNYAVTRPAREVLFTAVDRETRYKAKSFIDTVVYRGGDALSGWLFAGLKGLGLGLGAIAFLALPLSLIWAWSGYALGRQFRRMSDERETQDPP